MGYDLGDFTGDMQGLFGGQLDDYLRDYGIPWLLSEIAQNKAEPWMTELINSITQMRDIGGVQSNIYKQIMGSDFDWSNPTKDIQAGGVDPLTGLVRQYAAGTIEPWSAAEESGRLGKMYDQSSAEYGALRNKATEAAAQRGQNANPIYNSALGRQMMDINEAEALQRQSSQRDVFLEGENIRRQNQQALGSILGNQVAGLGSSAAGIANNVGQLSQAQYDSIMKQFAAFAEAMNGPETVINNQGGGGGGDDGLGTIMSIAGMLRPSAGTTPAAASGAMSSSPASTTQAGTTRNFSNPLYMSQNAGTAAMSGGTGLARSSGQYTTGQGMNEAKSPTGQSPAMAGSAFQNIFKNIQNGGAKQMFGNDTLGTGAMSQQPRMNYGRSTNPGSSSVSPASKLNTNAYRSRFKKLV